VYPDKQFPNALPDSASVGISFPAMRSSRPLHSDYYRDPLAALEMRRAKEKGEVLSERDLADLGNRPLPEFPHRTPIDGKRQWE
jgi:hypothetical protein